MTHERAEGPPVGDDITAAEEVGRRYRTGVFDPIDETALPDAPDAAGFPTRGHGPPFKLAAGVPRVPRLRHLIGPSVIALGMGLGSGEFLLWPNLIAVCTNRNLPLHLVNARLSERSARRYARFSAFTRVTLGRLASVGAQRIIVDDHHHDHFFGPRYHLLHVYGICHVDLKSAVVKKARTVGECKYTAKAGCVLHLR